MKIRNGIVTISPGDSLVNVSIRGMEVHFETEQEIEDINDLEGILSEMDVSTWHTEIRDCKILTTGDLAKRQASRIINRVQKAKKNEVELEGKRSHPWKFWNRRT